MRIVNEVFVEKCLKDVVAKEECRTCFNYKDGECRRFPPQVYWHPKTVRPDFAFPGVEENSYCAEYKCKA